MELELKMNINENIEITAIKESLFKRIQEKDFDFCSELNNTLNKVKY